MAQYIGTVDGVCGGRPVIKGTRIEPRHLKNYAQSNDFDGVLQDYPGLNREQVIAAFKFIQNNPRQAS